MTGDSGFGKYLKNAFLFHWNLLAVGAGTLAALISGRPDVALPIIAAGEIAFLAALATHPRFQAAIDAQEHKAARLIQEQTAAIKAKQLLASLSASDQKRFYELRSLCQNLRAIAQDMREEPQPASGIADMQSSGINRLLWIYLKLLYTKNALEKFFETIDSREIEQDITLTAERLVQIGPPEKDSDMEARKRKSLEDHLTTAQARMDNYRRARENYELIEVDLDRMVTKIASLSEMGINRQDPNFITSEVDSVSASVQQTERAMGELQFLSTLSVQDDAAPELLDSARSETTVT
jgi:chemotaxis protein histidine kinase CheA